MMIYMLMGASLAIIDHGMSGVPATASTDAQEAREHTPEYCAEDELNSADEYHSMGLNDMARDELRHAGYWIGELRKTAYTPEQQSLVRDLQMRHDLMAQKIK